MQLGKLIMTFLSGRLVRETVCTTVCQRLASLEMLMILILVSFISSSALQSQSAKAQTIRLVTGNNLAPYTDIRLTNGGLITELVEAVYNELGFETVISFGDWDQGYADTLGGRFEATFPYQPDQVKSDEFFSLQATFDSSTFNLYF